MSNPDPAPSLGVEKPRRENPRKSRAPRLRRPPRRPHVARRSAPPIREDGKAPNEHTRDKHSYAVPQLKPGDIRIIPLGGVEEIGQNMTAIEYQGEIVIIDIGVLFPDDDAPGVDYIIPDTTYLERNRDRVVGVIITHGHLDHIGGIPFVMHKIGNPTIYTTLLTAIMIKKRQEEFPHLPKLAIEVVAVGEERTLGRHCRFQFFGTTHTIPDTMGIIMHTPYGQMVFTGDIKIDHSGGIPDPDEVERFEALAKEKTLLLVADSTNIEKQGFSIPESEVRVNLRRIIEEAQGRLIIGTFASMLERAIFIIKTAEELGKKVALEGRSMKTNIEIAKEIGLLSLKRGTIIPSEEIGSYPDTKLVVLATGAQGEEFAALMRIANRQHKTVQLKKGDTVLLSSSVIPGNERAVQKLKDNLARQGARIIHNAIADVHSSGHSYRGELEWVHTMLKPRFFIPVHGHHYMLRVHADLAYSLGMPEKNVIVPDNGSVIEIIERGTALVKRKENVSAGFLMIDSLGKGDVKDVVVRDRQLLASDGMLVIIAIVNVQTGKVRKSPDIISRGFVYLKESQDLLRKVRFLTKKTIERAAQVQPINFEYVKNQVREDVGRFLFQETYKRPVILPALIEM